MTRKLASVQKVLNVRPIEGADMIEVVDVLGWSVVVKKEDGLKAGDLVLYYEIDSFLNANDPRYASFEERFINWGDKRGMRLKTIKLRKQVSQGLVLKVDQFPELHEQTRSGDYVFIGQEGDDVTELLKIEKWESLHEERSNNGGPNKTAGSKPFPSFIRKTDQERVQNYITELAKHVEETFEVTTKLDGSSMTIFRIERDSPNFAHAWEDVESRLLKRKSKLGRFFYKLLKKIGVKRPPTHLDGVCSRNIQLDIDGDNHFSAFVRRESILERLENLGMNIAVQGELIAPSIQENYEKVKDYEFYVYDIFDIDTQEYILPEERRNLVALLGLDSVPVLEKTANLVQYAKPGAGDARGLVDGILEFAEGPGMNPGVKREGVVFKSNKVDFSFKAISNSYLLKKKD
jgi:RNA ligase (TIGR02306 family)